MSEAISDQKESRAYEYNFYHFKSDRDSAFDRIIPYPTGTFSSGIL